MTKVGFSGPRGGMSEAQRTALMQELHRVGAVELHHGDCQGSDEQAHEVARQLGLYVVGHPPTSSGLRAFCVCDELREPAPFLERSRNLVLETAVLMATPDGPERRRSGTWTAIRFARRVSSTVVITPDGTIAPPEPTSRLW